MENSVHYIIEGVLAAGGFMVGLIIKRAYQSIDELWKKHDDMTEKLTEIAIELPKNYVTKNDLTHALDIIHDRFDKLDEKLEKIANRIPVRIKTPHDT
jgi:uncharacterized coiled-coil DUF342 family protein